MLLKIIIFNIYVLVISFLTQTAKAQTFQSSDLTAFSIDKTKVILNDSIGDRYCVLLFKQPYCTQCLNELETLLNQKTILRMKVVFILVGSSALTKNQFSLYIKEFLPTVQSVFFMESSNEILNKLDFQTNPHAIFVNGDEATILNYAQIFDIGKETGFTQNFLSRLSVFNENGTSDK